MCSLGYYGSIAADSGSCTACPIGKHGYNSNGERLNINAGCTNCTQGKFGKGSDGQRVSDLTGCDSCPSNSYSPPGSTQRSMCTCNIGYYGTITASSGSCTACPSGKYGTGTDGQRTTEALGCAPCTNPLLPYQYYSSNGGTSATDCQTSTCNNARQWQYYTSSGGASIGGCGVASCTPLSNNKYYSSTAGQVTRTTNTSCTQGTCTNAARNQYYSGPNNQNPPRTTSTSCPVRSCTNARVFQYYSGSGGNSAPQDNTCPVSNCTNRPPAGFYWSGGGGTTAASCSHARCNNALLNNQYYSSNGDISPTGCSVATCTNALQLGQYYSQNGFASPTGCTVSACTNKPSNSVYTPGAYNINANCAFQCVAGYHLDSQACMLCPGGTFSVQGAVGPLQCQACTSGVHFPAGTAVVDTVQTGLSACVWNCRPGYRKAPDGSATCIVASATIEDRLTVKNYALVADRLNATHTRLARLNISDETTQTLGVLNVSLVTLVLLPASDTALRAYGMSSAGVLHAMDYAPPGPARAAPVAGVPRLWRRFGAPASSDFILVTTQQQFLLYKLFLANSTMLEVFDPIVGCLISATASSRDGSFAVSSCDGALFRVALLPPHDHRILAGAPESLGFLDGDNETARLRPALSVAVAPDASAAYVLHPAALSASDCVLRRVDLLATPAQVTTVLRSAYLSDGSISFGTQSDILWVASPLSFTVAQLSVANASQASVLSVFGSAGQGYLDDVTPGLLHTEKFQSPFAVSAWACARRGYDCAAHPAYALPCLQGYTSAVDGPCTPCPPGTYSPSEASQSCSVCPPDAYANIEGSAACYPCAPSCPQGTYFTDCGGQSQGACTPCPRDCPADRYRADCSGSSVGACVRCPSLPAVNQYYSGESDCSVASCSNPLNPGEFWSFHGGTSSTNCTSSPCENRPRQSIYTPSENLGPACDYECLPGHTGPACEPCDPGFFAPTYDSPQCSPCSQGSFASDPASSLCQLCRPGRFMPLQNATACFECPEKTFTQYEGSTDCVPCQQGSVAPRGSSACQQCQPGSVAHPSNSTHCQPCQPGSAANLPGMTVCSPCRQGYVARRASASCSPCLPGTFADAAAEYCHPCPEGLYSSQPATACLSCPPGQVPYSPTGPCSLCPKGHVSLSGNASCSPCPAFTYSPDATARCLTCVRGFDYPTNAYLVATTGNAECDFRCNEGYIFATTLLTKTCVAFNKQLPYFTFRAFVLARVSSSRRLLSTQLSQQDIAVYNQFFADSLGVTVFQVFTSQDTGTGQLVVVVQSQTEAQASALAAQVRTDSLQRKLNSFTHAYLGTPVVDKATLTLSFQTAASPPAPTPSPPTVINVPAQPRFSAACANARPSYLLVFPLILANLLKNLF